MLQESLCPTTVLDLGVLWQEMSLLLQPSTWCCDFGTRLWRSRLWERSGTVPRAPWEGRSPISLIPLPRCFLEPSALHGASFCKISALQTQNVGNEIQSVRSHFGLKYNSDIWILVSAKNPKIGFFFCLSRNSFSSQTQTGTWHSVCPKSPLLFDKEVLLCLGACG